uniref:UDENN domain-containing protein n=1 Tax=Angiostrongylus cantonensis TaxID=6313 RepID=A0A0K0CWD2_ANGCA
MPRPGGSVGMKDKCKDKESTKKPHEKEKPTEKNEPKSQTDSSRISQTTTKRTSEQERKHSVRPTDELKLLQDSLTHFFTPSAGRRCRQPPRKFDESGVNSDDSVQPTKSPADSGCEKTEPLVDKTTRRKKSLIESSFMKPLTVDIDSKVECTGSCSSTISAPSEPSPSRRVCEKLVDSLSPYFSTSSEKRRTAQKGEFAQLNSFRSRSGISERSSQSSPQSPSSAREVKFEAEESASTQKQASC